MLRSTALVTAMLTASHAAAEPVEWTLDLGHAHVGWEIDHMNMANNRGPVQRLRRHLPD